MGDNLNFFEKIVPATVNIHSYISYRNPSVKILGHERMGTGSIFTAEGHILTVGYIVMGAKEITLALPDKKEYSAQVVYIDYDSGLAIIKAEGADFPVVPMEYSYGLKVPDKVLVLGSTNKHERRVTQGFVTSIKPFDSYWEYMLDKGIMTTAVNPGFGGGPMFDNLGKMVGIVSLNLNSVKEMTMAIPIDLFHKIKDEVLEHGTVRGRVARPWIGAYTITAQRGVIVVGLVPEGPAFMEGLQLKDVLTEINGVKIKDRRQFYEELWRGETGRGIDFTALRNETEKSIRVQSLDRAVFYGQI